MKQMDTTSSFLDVLFNIVLSFFVLLILLIQVVNPPTKSGDIPLKAEILITMEWPANSNDDVDLFVKTPASDIPVFYGNRDIKAASLDRDDRGTRNDTIYMSDGTSHVIYENWEHIAIRKMVPGEYIINTFMYHKLDKEVTPVNVKVEKLNPYQVIYSGVILLSAQREERTAIRFTLDNKSRVVERTQIFESLTTMLNFGN